jgi:asparagine synthase (glutamine-hydrolysing)
MYRFLAVLWNARDESSAQEAERWTTLARRKNQEWDYGLDVPGARVLCLKPRSGGLRAYPLQSDQGVVLGRLFLRGTAVEECVTDISPTRASRIVASAGQSLTDDYWGAYVAFLVDHERNLLHVVRDCSGKLPCFRARVGRITFVFAVLDDLVALVGRRFPVNTKYIAAFLVADDVRIRETALDGVQELLAGDCWTQTERGDSQFAIWNPARVHSKGAVDEYDTAVLAVRDTAQHCIDSWASVHRSILHRLSGGLDSAIVLGCLKRSPSHPKIACVNRYTSKPGEDERKFARVAATAANVHLVESEWHSGEGLLDSRILDAPLLAKPSVQSLLLHDVAFTNALANRYDAEATWTGQGGDHLFLQSGTPLIAADFIRERGFGRGLSCVVHDVARLTRTSYWSILRNAWLYGSVIRQGRPQSLFDQAASLLRRDAFPDDFDSFVQHPWIGAIVGLPKAKQLQVSMLADLLNRPWPTVLLECAPEHHQLISQPLVELCIRIPTYLLVRGGRNRALARDAFADVLPREISRREGKGESTSYMTSFLRDHKPFLQQLLLDGFLVRERLVARETIERYVSCGQPMSSMQLFPVLACVAAEVWAQSWSSSATEIAA